MSVSKFRVGDKVCVVEDIISISERVVKSSIGEVTSVNPETEIISVKWYTLNHASTKPTIITSSNFHKIELAKDVKTSTMKIEELIAENETLRNRVEKLEEELKMQELCHHI